MFTDKNKKIAVEDLSQKTPDTFNLIQNDSGNEGNDIISLTAVNEILKDKKTTSRVKVVQVPTLAKLYLFSSTFNSPFAKKLADNILQLQVSINGLGRKELVQLVQRRFDTYEGEKPLTGKDIFR